MVQLLRLDVQQLLAKDRPKIYENRPEFKGSIDLKQNGVCGLVGLGMVLWFLVWVIRLNARQALLNHHQRVMSNQYLQRKETEEKRQTPWWHLWPNKGWLCAPPLQPNVPVAESSKTDQKGDAKEPKQEEENPAPPRLTILCDASVESANVPPYCRRQTPS
ncbi:unnamed protein product [Penicillium camemberti]|uniref:Str. FM013 n=1 Tax=Penicillium camemberti (strain FM 013) TaxID=1429867 RepID=A0A0G4PEY9_PENC3|nr:unnamed protein product [Penicillium camemberti]